MTNAHAENFHQVFRAFLDDLATDFNMPELHEPFPNDPPGTLEVQIRPRGQMRLFIKSLHVTVKMWDSFTGGPEDKYNVRAPWLACVELSYEHHDGGRNGKKVDLMVDVYQNPIKDTFIYKTYFRHDTLRRIEQWIYDRTMTLDM